MRRGSVGVAPSWWSRVAMTGRSVAWRSCRRLHPVDIHERTAQWRQEGWTGYAANALTSTPIPSAATTTRSAQEQARAQTRVADQGATTRRVEGQQGGR